MLVLVTFHLSLISSLAQVDSLYHVFERQMGPLRVETGNELMQALLSEGFGDDLTFSPQTHPDTLTMTASYYAAEYFLNVRQLDRCLDAALTALPLTKGNDDYTWQSETLNLLTLAYFYLSNYGEALRYGEMGYAIDSQQQDYERMSSTLNTLAGIYLAARQPQQARQYTDKAIDADRRTADHLHAPAIYGCASEVYQELGLYDQALDYARQALDYEQRQGGHPSKMAIRQAQMATACSAVGDTARARQLLLECIPVLAEGGVMPSLGISLNTLGEVMRKEGRTDAAARYFEQARQLFLQTGDLYNQARSLHGLFAALYDSDPKTAMLHLDDYTKLKDSIYQDDMKQMLSNYSTRFHVSQLTEQNAEAQRTNRIIIIGAIVIVLLLILVLAFVVYAMRTKSKANQQLLDLQHTREDFFTNITHEFRTPLTVILGMSQKLKDATADGDIADVHTAGQMIERQGSQLLQLINQLLDLSKVKAHVTEPSWRTDNIVAYLNMIMETFYGYAHDHGIQLIYAPRENEVMMDFVPDYVQKIVNNLLSNAIKFTPENGHINITTRRDPNQFVLQVADDGVGIDRHQLSHIFEPFYQAANSEAHAGTGVGLALTRQLIASIDGDISVASSPGRGTVFTITMPLHHGGGQWQQLTEEEKKGLALPQTGMSTGEQTLTDSDPEGERTRLLIVEDNHDVAYYIGQHLQDQYDIFYATNGRMGLEKAQQLVPDLIITDLMMPEMDGLELCRQVRSSELTSHIPIIVITARSTREDLIQGIEAGADAYLYKPFSTDELTVRVEKLLEQRQQLRQKFARIGTADSSQTAEQGDEQTALTPADTKFIGRITDLVYSLMGDQQATVDVIADRLCMSPSQLRRKVQALTGKTPAAYFLQIRLSNAKRMLDGHPEMSVSDVAYRCGFSDLPHFSHAFKEAYGLSPSQWMKRAH